MANTTKYRRYAFMLCMIIFLCTYFEACTEPCKQCTEVGKCEQCQCEAGTLQEQVMEGADGSDQYETKVELAENEIQQDESIERVEQATEQSEEQAPEETTESEFPITTVHFSWPSRVIHALAMHPTKPLLLVALNGPEASLYNINTKRVVRTFGPGLIPSQMSCEEACMIEAEWCYQKTCWKQEQSLGHIDLITKAKFSKTGTSVLTTSVDGTAIIWKLDNGDKTILGPGRKIVPNTSCALYWRSTKKCSNGQVCYAGICWESDPQHGHNGNVTEILFDEQRNFAYTAGEDARILEWNVATKQISRVFEQKHTAGIRHMYFFDNDTAIVSVAKDQTIRIWDVKSGRQTNVIVYGKPYDEGKYAITFCEQTQRIYMKDFYGNVEVYNMKTIVREFPNEFVVKTPYGFAAAVNLAGTMFVGSRLYGEVDIINTSTRKVIKTLPSGIKFPDPLPPKGQECSDQLPCPELFNCIEGYCYAQDNERGHVMWVEGAKWSPDGRYVMTSDLAGNLFVWPFP